MTPAPPVDDHAGVVLDWRDPSHYARRPAPCRHCWQPTHLRDEGGRPAHKTCTEAALTRAAVVEIGEQLA